MVDVVDEDVPRRYASEEALLAYIEAATKETYSNTKSPRFYPLTPL